MLTLADRWVIADRYYAEGSAVVDQADAPWARAHDPAVPADFRAVALADYRVLAARARSLFRRGEVQLDTIARLQGIAFPSPTGGA